MPTVTRTRTFTAITPANPHLRCEQCGQRVESWLDKPGPLENEPCGHEADYRNDCPSWSPVDGCQCQEHLGHVPHERSAA